MARLSKVMTTTAARAPGAGGPVPTQGPSSLPAQHDHGQQHTTYHHMQLQQRIAACMAQRPSSTRLPAAHLEGKWLCLPLVERFPRQAAPPPPPAAGAGAAPGSHQSCCFAANRQDEGQAGPFKLKPPLGSDICQGRARLGEGQVLQHCNNSQHAPAAAAPAPCG